jgi:N-dimethylarginine dimethylaminohydrolase
LTSSSPQEAVASTTADRPVRRYVMCAPRYFDVVYRINPWMHPRRPVDQARAQRQWAKLRRTLESLGNEVLVVDPVPGLPDMVFAANSALVIGDRAVAARMASPQRRGEEQPYQAWLASHGVRDLLVAEHPNEGEGDFVLVGGRLLGGTGFRTAPAAHAETAAFFGVEFDTLHLCDPRWYHLDTALFAVDDENIAYYPGAFREESRRLLEERFPDAIVVTEADALAFGCNAISDGRRVVLEERAERLAQDLDARGLTPVPVDMTEFHRAGGSAKCCVLELHPPIAS